MSNALKETEFANLPSSWDLVLLDELALVKDGTHITPEYTEAGVPFLRVTDIKGSALSLSNVKYISEDEHRELTRYTKPERGDILYSKNGTIGVPCVVDWDWEFSIFVSLALLKIRDRGRIDTSYLACYLASDLAKKEIYRGSKQATVTNLHLEEIRKFRVPLPPLPEQRAIADILNTWDKAITLTEALIEALQTRKKALMQRLLTGEVRFPEFEDEWQSEKLGNLCINKAAYGANASAIDYASNKPRYIRITDIDNNGRLLEHTRASIELTGNEEYILKKGDFLFARSGATVGKTYLYDQQHGLCIYAGYLIKFVPDENWLLPEFLKQYTQSHLYWLWVQLNIRAGAQPNINAQEYSSLTLPLPSIEEQKKIVGFLENFDEEMSILREYQAMLQQQKRGLMQQFLTGQIRVRVEE